VKGKHQQTQSTGSVVAAVLHDLLREESFAREADLRDALKQWLTRYRVAWTNDEIDQALRIVEHRRSLTMPEIADGASGVELPSQAPNIDRAEARHILNALGIGSTAIKTMPQAELVTQREADIRKALEMVATEMQASVARCDALEAALVEPGDEGTK
jgi:hypothetical protein